VRTLSVYLRHHGSHKQSARILHLHTNTVAYRVARIEDITGLDLGDPDDRLIAHVAVKIIESQGSEQEC
jgi:DNA-binding PucR family transcriptional regulator